MAAPFVLPACFIPVRVTGAIRTSPIVVAVVQALDYLVIGDIGNENWAHSTHGRKIEKAIAYNFSGCRIAIVSEEHWLAHL
jgi:hypothetical protein